MPGAIAGDIVGLVYEINNHRSKDFPLFREDAISIGGDSDTLAATTESIAEAR